MNQPVRAGFSKIDITPPIDRIEAHGIGYWYQRSVRFSGIRDLLFARTLVIGEDDSRYVIVSVDSILDSYGFGATASLGISNSLGIDPAHVFITCTHTHSSPLIDRNGTRQGEEYGAFVADRIVESATMAARNSKPTVVSISTGRVHDALYNRRPLLRNGRIAELHRPLPSEALADAGPVNDTMTIVNFRTGNGQRIGGLCHFGIHGVAVQCSDLLSSDCMGRAIQAFEQESDEPIVLLHLNGPCGDIDPIMMGDDQALDTMTSRLLNGIREITNAEEHPIEKPALAIAFRGTFRATRRPTRSAAVLERARQALAASAQKPNEAQHHSGPGYEAFLLAEETTVGALPGEFDISYQILRWGKLVLLGIAGEVFTSSGLALQAPLPRALILPVGLTGGAVGYLPTEEMFEQGGYEVACARWCPIAPGETEKLFAQIGGALRRVVEGVVS